MGRPLDPRLLGSQDSSNVDEEDVDGELLELEEKSVLILGRFNPGAFEEGSEPVSKDATEVLSGCAFLDLSETDKEEGASEDVHLISATIIGGEGDDGRLLCSGEETGGDNAGGRGESSKE